MAKIFGSLAYIVFAAIISLLLTILLQRPLTSFIRWLGFGPESLSTVQIIVITALFTISVTIPSTIFAIKTKLISSFFEARNLRNLRRLEDVFAYRSAGWTPQTTDLESEIWDQKSIVREAITSITDAARFEFGPGENVIMVTSGQPADGKSTLVLGMALTLVGRGLRVLIVDADMRSPVQHKLLNMSADVGLTSLLSSKMQFNEVISETDVPGLFLLPAGPVPPTTNPLLHQLEADGLIAKLKDEFDFVLIDTPPVLVD